jgi:hypothetical protein
MDSKDKGQSKYKEYYDSGHKNVNIELGDSVLLYRAVQKNGTSGKLSAHWDGPFKVITRLNNVT